MVLAGVIGTCILIPILLISLRWTRAAFDRLADFLCGDFSGDGRGWIYQCYRVRQVRVSACYWSVDDGGIVFDMAWQK